MNTILLLFLLFSIASAQVQIFHDVISHQYLINWLYSYSSRFSSPPSYSGAISVNQDWEQGQSSVYFIELQRYVGNWVSAGVVLTNSEYIDTGYLIANWGLSRQATDGSGTFPGTEDGVHSTSLFLEAVAKGSIVLENRGITSQTSV